MKSTWQFLHGVRSQTMMVTMAAAFAVGALVLLTGARPAFAYLHAAAPGAAPFREDRILVKPNPGADLTIVHTLLGIRVLRTYPAIGGLEVLQLPQGVTVADAIAAYQQSGLVAYAEPDFIVEAQLTPNDFRYWDGSLWSLNNTGQLGGLPDADIDAPEGWDTQNSASNIVVAVIDTGIRLTHEDLAGNLWINSGESGPGLLGVDKGSNGLDDDGDGYVDDVHGINAVLGTGVPLDDHGHGTHVSGTLGGVGNNRIGVAGVAWRVQIMACKFLDSTAHGSLSDAIECINYARQKKANIINASWGGYDFTSTALYDAIASVRQAGILFVAAAGNDGTDNDVNPLYPASYDLDNILAVAATTRQDDRAGWSNYGASTVDLGAPGLDIFSTWNGSDSDYQYYSGTSMATPHVVGVCPVVWARYPNETYSQIINRVLSNTDPLPALMGKTVSGGRLNLQKSLGATPAGTIVAVTATDSLASENGPDPGTFTVSRTGSTVGPLTVIYTLGGTAANGSDYSYLPGSVTIPAGAAAADITVNPIDDTAVEGNESIVLALSPSNAYRVGAPNSATITIADNDAPPVSLPPVTVTSPVALASESGPKAGAFRIRRERNRKGNLTVYFTLGGTAGNGSDYRTLPKSVTIPSGAGSVTVRVVPIDDKLVEGEEDVVLDLQPDPAYQIGSPNKSKVTITDNDAATASRPRIMSNAAGASVLSVSGGGAPQQFQLTGMPNTTYAVQATTNLADWATIFTGQSAPDGTLRITDGAMGLFHSRFYRARQVAGLAANQRPDRLLVKPLPGVDLSPLNLALGVTVLQAFSHIGNLQILQVPANITSDALINLYQQSGLVQYAEHDFIVHALTTPDDFYYQQGNQWNLNNTGQQGGTPDADIDGPEGWDARTDAAEVLIAVIDTGVRYTHRDLAPNIWVNPGELPGNGIDDDGNGYVDDAHGINAISGRGDPADDHGHGTHVSGILGAAGNDSLGIAGVCWRVQIMACKFLDSQGSGSISDAITCIDYARSKGAKIINASWGTTAFNSAAFRDAIDSARAADIIFVAAAGNSGEDNQVNPVYPASYDLDNIVSVAATTRTDDLASFSNYGATNVDLAAPGSPIFSCWGGADDSYQYMDGTSMAAAHVSGVCALLRAHYPNETYRQIINRVLSSTDPRPGLAGKCVTGGRLNLANALGGVAPPAQPVITVTATDPNASETGPDPGVFRFHRTGDTSQPLDVSWTISGSAVNGSDYQQLPTTGTIPAGQADADLTITPIDDTLVEGDETVVVTVVGSTGYTAGSPATATVTITDNDGAPPPDQPVVTLEELDPNASETGPDPGVIRFHRTGDTSQPLDVSWTFSGTAINGSDYQQLPTTGTIPAGQAQADLTITPIDDTAVEGNETVVVTVISGPGYTNGSPSTATVTIADNDSGPPPTPTVTVTASDPNAAESGPNTGAFTLSRSGDTSAALTVNYTVGGTATSGADYQSLGTSATIPAGASSATVTVTPVDDTAVEGNETVVLTLASGAGYAAGSPNSATVTIADNDTAPPPPATVTVVATQPLASLLIPGEFTITRAGDVSSALTVNYSLGGTAVNGVDYQALSGSAVIPAGASSMAVLVQPRTSLSLLRTVVLTLSPGSNYNVGSPNSATVTIVASIGLSP